MAGRADGLGQLAGAFEQRFGAHRTQHLTDAITALGILDASELIARLDELKLPQNAKDFIATLTSEADVADARKPSAKEPAREADVPSNGLEQLADAFEHRFGAHRTQHLTDAIEALGITNAPELIERLDQLKLPQNAKDFVATLTPKAGLIIAPAPSAEPARAASRSASRLEHAVDDDVSASIDRPPRRIGNVRNDLRDLGYGRADDETRGEYAPLKLEPHHDDLGDVISKLTLTIAQWKQHSDSSVIKWKQRKLTYRMWNSCSSVVILEQALAVATVLHANNSALVAIAMLLETARKVDPSTRPVRHKVQSGRETGGANDTFRPWLRQMLYPAVLFFDFDAADSLARCFAYAHPHNLDAQSNLAASVKAETTRRTPMDVRAVLEKVNVAGYLKALPSNSHKRVLRALIGDMCESASFLKTKLGMNPVSVSGAQQKVHAAFAVMSDMETRTQTVSSNTTNAGTRRREHAEFDLAISEMLADAHGGGGATIVEKTEKLGVDFHRLIESCAEKLGRHNYDGESNVGECATNRARDSTVGVRDCSWGALADRVQAKIREKQSPGDEPISVSASCVRQHCVARYIRTVQGRTRHIGDAQVSVKRLSSTVSDDHPDAHMSCASVMIAEEALFDLASSLKELGVRPLVLYRLWDDHAKWNADQKRGFDRHRTVMHRKVQSNAPTSDMGLKVGGGKATTNSILAITPDGVYDADVTEGWPLKTKRDQPCHKQAYAVTRLEFERRSTPTQQVNDWRYVQHSDPQLAAVTQGGGYLVSLADCGFDHSVRNPEYQYMNTLDHLKVRPLAVCSGLSLASQKPNSLHAPRSVGSQFRREHGTLRWLVALQ